MSCKKHMDPFCVHHLHMDSDGLSHGGLALAQVCSIAIAQMGAPGQQGQDPRMLYKAADTLRLLRMCLHYVCHIV